MKIYDLSQPLNADCSFWPYYPPFEVKYIKRKSEHGVNAQYIMTSNHMGTHLDAPRHFVTDGDDRQPVHAGFHQLPQDLRDGHFEFLVEEVDLHRSERLHVGIDGLDLTPDLAVAMNAGLCAA